MSAPALRSWSETAPWVALGGVVGALLSLVAIAAVAGFLGDRADALAVTLLWAALVNTVGSFLLGWLRSRAQGPRGPVGLLSGPRASAAVGTGMLGSFTSFSALSGSVPKALDSLSPVMDAPTPWGPMIATAVIVALAGAVLVIVVGTLAAAAGLALGRRGGRS